jgi:hypothetical protein
MCDSTVATVTPASPDLQALVDLLGPAVQHLAGQVQAFRAQPPTPERTCAFERQVAATLQEAGRVVLERVYNALQPARLEDCPQRLRCAGETYRRRPKSRNRIGTLFGEIALRRYLYEPLERGERALFPLELQLGIEAGLATPALAERVGRWAAEHEQAQVQALLRQEHGVTWSVKSLRRVTASLCDGLASFRAPAQEAKLLELLGQAFASRGQHRPVLAAGRDGIMVPLRGEGYHEAATATVSVYDRRGQRRGTVYLGRMPESGQGTLSDQLTALLTRVLTAWHARGRAAPRLAYVTDAGDHPRTYYRRVLRRLSDPWRPGHPLAWEWVVDFWHACGYVQRLAEGLFGAGARAWGWFRKWRCWLRDRASGAAHVLRSAMWHYNNGPRRTKDGEALFWKGYRYLRRHAPWLHYAECRRRGLPIGSGVTEAACKTVFAERLKRSGMTWGREGGQVIVDLRTLTLSGVWPQAHAAYLASRPRPTVVKPASDGHHQDQTLTVAA